MVYKLLNAIKCMNRCNQIYDYIHKPRHNSQHHPIKNLRQQFWFMDGTSVYVKAFAVVDYPGPIFQVQ